MANTMADKKKTSSLNQMAELNVQDGGKEKEQDESSRTVTRERVEPKERESKTVVRERENKPNRRDNKAPSAAQNLRNNRIVRFFFEAYYELRHKVTWPTFEQARNLTIVVLVLSAALGILLSLVDLGLSQLFFLINNLPGIK